MTTIGDMISARKIMIATVTILSILWSCQCLLHIKQTRRIGLNSHINVHNVGTRFSLTPLSIATTRPHSSEYSEVLSSPRLHDINSKSLNLPHLTRQDKLELAAGERIQLQYREGRSGRGLVVLDVPAAPETVFNTLSLFDRYESLIPTVRSVNMYNSEDDDALVSHAEFSLSKFRLKVNVVHTICPEDQIIRFTLDRNRPNLVMREADGFWLVQAPADRPPGYSRVWLSANIVVSRVVPTMLVDYAAARALPRATTWLQSFFA